MKIAIIGTRGVPNHYGGFEQFAEYLSEYLAKDGHDVTVYNSHTHPYQEKEWKGVKIKHCFDPENKLGTIGQFIYDLNCIMHCRRSDYDIILQLGYTSNSIWGSLLPKRAVIVTNMDGMEWKRSKYSKKVQKFLQWAEKRAVETSDFLISDSIGIQDYLLQKYKVRSEYIPYGAHLFEHPDTSVLDTYGLSIHRYDMLIARLEPENSIDSILEGVAASTCERSFLVIGKNNTEYGNYLKNKYAHCEKIKFVGGIYDIRILNNLRYFSNIYFHGHTVGGTNPSLLEAMSSNAYICAHRNIFNFSILGNDATYFTNPQEVTKMIDTLQKNSEEARAMLYNNYRKIKTTYSWEDVNAHYITFMIDAYKEKNFRQKGLGELHPEPRFYTRLSASESKRLRELEEENAKLKSMYADLSIVHNTFKEAVTRSMS